MLLQPHDPRFVGRPTSHEPRAYLVEVAATAHALDGNGQHVTEISWIRMTDGWFAAWYCKPSHRVGEGKFIRAPHLDTANTIDLGHTIGQVVTPGCFNYGENGVLDPIESTEQVEPERRRLADRMFSRLQKAIQDGNFATAQELVSEMDRLGLWGDHPRGDDTTPPPPGHVYSCCGKTGRISPHRSWCKVGKPN